MTTKITLPTVEENKGSNFHVTDWAMSNGADGTNAWTRVSDSSKHIRCNLSISGGYDLKSPDTYGIVIRPRFQNPEQSHIDTIEMSGNEQFLTFGGNPAYYPRTKITGDVFVVRKIDDLSFTSCHQITYESYEIIANGKRGYATKLPSASKYQKLGDSGGMADDFSYRKPFDWPMYYADGTEVPDYGAVWHLLEPVQAKKQHDGSIQIVEGILPVVFEPYRIFQRSKIKGKFELDTNDFKVGHVMKNYVWKELANSAEKLSTLNKPQTMTVIDLFGQLLKGVIDEDGLRKGLKEITKTVREKEGATIEDAQALTEEIRQASVIYTKAKNEKLKAERLAQQKQEEVKQNLEGKHIKSAFKDIDAEIDTIKL